MINVTVGNNLKRKSVLVNENKTLKSVLEEQHIDYSRGMMNIDGAPLSAGELNKTFAELGYSGEVEGKDSCYLLNVVKADNAA